MRLSEKSFKKDAKKLKKVNPNLTTTESLDRIAKDNNYQSWIHAKKCLSILKNNSDFHEQMKSEDVAYLCSKYQVYLDRKDDEKAFYILCRLFEVVGISFKESRNMIRIQDRYLGPADEEERFRSLSTLNLYIHTNLAWHQALGQGCEIKLEEAKRLFNDSCVLGRNCDVAYGVYSYARFNELQENYHEAEKLYLYIIEKYLQNAGSYYQLAKLHLERRIKNVDITDGDHFLKKAKKKGHPEARDTLDRYNKVRSKAPFRSFEEFHDRIISEGVFSNHDDCRPDANILIKALNSVGCMI
ncbi:sel1 repeat family protein [Moritella sp. 28]|uniref:sel1 repeat family protein n=1 Tax=Moritella sp. 28 TaxID=2746232 RepID=UPI001BA4C228|nr:sel1 repeat family protein [Moritella sp. 28]QUM85968.1 sel1 repeat family protein [Moritella sp. 28]